MPPSTLRRVGAHLAVPLACALAVAAPSATLAAPRLAVLLPTASWSPECQGAAWRKDRELLERCTLLETLADEARAGALSAFDTRVVDVMTRENMAQLLLENGGACAEGECEVETAKIVGADFVVSGNVTQVEGTWFATLKIHAVKNAKLLGTSPRLEGASQVALIKAVRPAAESMLRGALTLAQPPAERPRADPGGPWYVTLDGGWLAALDVPGPTSGISVSARAGYRIGPRLSLEAGADLRMVKTDRKGDLYVSDEAAVETEADWAFAGAELSLLGRRTLAVAAAIGAGRIDVHAYAKTDEARVASYGPLATAELRLALPLSWGHIGLAGGVTALYVGAVPRPVYAANGANPGAYFEAEKGLMIEPHVHAFLRFAL